jgi:serine/threonine protein phosphatase 1
MKRFAISDIHGCAKTFEALLQKINFTTNDQLYLLGDFIDRGQHSKGVFDLVFALISKGYAVHCLRGNHEQMLLDAFDNQEYAEHWTNKSGGQATLQSFGANSIHQIPDNYLEFIDAMPYYFSLEDYLMVHGGFNFDLLNPLLDKDAMLWIRNWYGRINHVWLDGRIIIHGHTPRPRSIIERGSEHLEATPAINIDCGCVYTLDEMHQLCALDLDAQILIFQPNVEVSL